MRTTRVRTGWFVLSEENIQKFNPGDEGKGIKGDYQNLFIVEVVTSTGEVLKFGRFSWDINHLTTVGSLRGELFPPNFKIREVNMNKLREEEEREKKEKELREERERKEKENEELKRKLELLEKQLQEKNTPTRKGVKEPQPQ